MVGMLIDVETDDFLATGSLASQAASAARAARRRAHGALSSTHQMAGSDPAGNQWAASYDKAAKEAFAGLDGLVLAYEEVAAGLTVTGNTYATADWLSSGHSGTAPGAVHPATPTGDHTSPPPSASGGSRSFGAPGFDLVAKFIGDLWPDGDTGKLKSAGAVWNALGGDLDSIADQWSSILMVLGDSNTPEMPSIRRTVQAVKSHTSAMASQARAIGAAATSFAGHVDEVHTETERELESLLLQVELTAAGGLVLTFVTAGMSDAAAAAGATAEVAGAVTRILAFIARLASAAARIAEDISEGAGAFVKASTLSEKIGVKVAAFAGKAARYGLSGSATNVAVTAITDPGGNLGDAAVSGFVAGAGFGVLGEGALAGKSVASRLASTVTGDAVRSTPLAEMGLLSKSARESLQTDDNLAAVFGEDLKHHYEGDNPKLGRPDSAFFVMPASDSSRIKSVSDAARLTGRSPSTERAYLQQDPTKKSLYAIVFPKGDIPLRLPTEMDADGWPHFLPGGHTAVRIDGPNGGFLVNPTREFVLPGGTPVPSGAILVRIEGSQWEVLRVMP